MYMTFIIVMILGCDQRGVRYAVSNSGRKSYLNNYEVSCEHFKLL